MLGICAIDLWAEQAEAPGVGEEVGTGLQDPLAAAEIVLGVAVEVPTQPSHSAPVPRLQPDINPRTWGGMAQALAHQGTDNVAQCSEPTSYCGTEHGTLHGQHVLSSGISLWHGHHTMVLGTSSPPQHGWHGTGNPT